MDSGKLPLWSILTIEGLVVCLVVIFFLIMVVRKLRGDLSRLGGRINELNAQLRSVQSASPPAPVAAEKSYRDWLEEQLAATRDYHGGLANAGDIAMDLDPQTPEQRRVAAMRHALLVAEIDANQAESEPNWSFLADRYQQLLSFNRDYAPDNDTSQSERYRAKYQRLEQLWRHCDATASKHYAKLTELAEQQPEASELPGLLTAYHGLHVEFSEQVFTDQPANRAATADEHPASDLQQLRELASRHHQIIEDLQSQLEHCQEGDLEHNLIASLQSELKAQARFMRESDTCIQVLEEELNAANRKLNDLQNSIEIANDRKAGQATG